MKRFLIGLSRRINTLNLLESRNLISQTSDSNKLRIKLESKQTIYTGFDPTAPSLHVGNLLTIIALLHFQTTGHQIIALVGGATGGIGDPSGKKTERQALEKNIVENNILCIQNQLNYIFENAKIYAEKRKMSWKHDPLILNNAIWYENMNMIDFLLNVGKKSRISAMLARDSVKGRLEGGISATEFTYQLLQAYDFWHLYSNYGCNIQLGGSDQWGNITCGLELIRKNNIDNVNSNGKAAYGITIPLVTTPTGEKFGKSEGNAIFITDSFSCILKFYNVI